MDQNVLNFMQSFWKYLANFYVVAPSWRVGALSYEESWINPWRVFQFVRINGINFNPLIFGLGTI